MNTQRYTVNVRVGGIGSPRVAVSQGDIGRRLVFNLFDGAVAFAMTSGTTVTIVGRKPSGLGFDETCTHDGGNSVSVRTTEAMTQEAGKIPAELRISDGTKVIGTANFVFYVEPSPHPDGTTDGTLEEARTVLARCEEYAQQAQDAAETAEEVVVEAVDDWLTQHPEATTTVQDGAITETKLALSTLKNLTNVKSVYNVLNYGVLNTNAGDQSSAINAVIALCENHDTVYLPNGKYRITNPININKAINFICDGEIRCVLSSAGYGVVISQSLTNVYINRISANNNNSGCVQIYSSSNVVRYVSLHINEVSGNSANNVDYINVTANEYSVYYCKISGKWIYGSLSSNGIVFRKLSQEATIGDIKIYDVSINHCNNAIYAGDENLLFGSGNVNSIIAINVGIEGNNNGFYYKNLRSPVILNCRVTEQQGIQLLTFEGFVYQGYYSGRTPLKLLSIRFVNPKKVSEYSNSEYWYSGFYVNSPCYFQDIDTSPKMFAIIDGGKIYTSPVTLEERDMTV